MDDTGNAAKVNVSVRLRPLIQREEDNKEAVNWDYDGTFIRQVLPGSKTPVPSHGNTYTFDAVFGPKMKTTEVYDRVVAPIVEKSFLGFNGTILCYGQTSSGKTYTLYGTDEIPGIITLTANHLFQRIKNDQDRTYYIRVGLLEVYNEKVTDLLNRSSPVELKEQDGVVIPKDLKEIEILHAEDMLNAAKVVQSERKIGETNMNKESSRSHTILRIIIESVSNDEEEDGDVGERDSEREVTTALLNFVDLAGSEKVSQTGAEGIRFKEAGFINKSLFTLARVVHQLSLSASSNGSNTNGNRGISENSSFSGTTSTANTSVGSNVFSSAKSLSKQAPPSVFVSYRDSKLTRLLSSSLCGNAYITLICNVTPAAIDETHSTLRFAKDAKKIKLVPMKNQGPPSSAQYRNKITELESQLVGKASEVERLRKELEFSLQGKTSEVETLKKQIASMSRFIQPSARPVGSSQHTIPDRRKTLCPSMLGGLRKEASLNSPSQAHLFLDDFKIPAIPSRHSCASGSVKNVGPFAQNTSLHNPFDGFLPSLSTHSPFVNSKKGGSQNAETQTELDVAAVSMEVDNPFETTVMLRATKLTAEQLFREQEHNKSLTTKYEEEKSFWQHEKEMEAEEHTVKYQLLIEENNALQSKINEKHEVIDQLEQKIQNLQSSHDAQEKDAREFFEELHTVRIKMIKIEQHNQILQQQLETKSDHEKNTADQEIIRQQLTKSQEELQNRDDLLKEATQQIEELQTALNNSNMLVVFHQSQLARTEKAMSEQYEILSHLQMDTLGDVKNVVNSLTDDKRSLESQLKEVEDSYNNKCHSLGQEKETIQHQLTKTQKELQTQSDLLNEAAENGQELETAVKNSESLIASLQAQLEQTENTVSELNEVLSSLQVDSLGDVKNAFTTLTDDKRRLESQLKEVEDSYNNKCHTIGQEKEAIQLQLSKSQEELQTQSTLLKEAAEKGQELEIAVQNSESSRTSLQAQLEQTENTVSELNEVLSSLQMDTLGDVKNAFTTLTDDKRRLESQLKEVEDSYNNKCHTLGQENKGMELQLSKSQAELQTQSNILKEATAQIQELQIAVNNSEDVIACQQSQLALMEKAMAEQNDVLTALQLPTLRDIQNAITSLMDKNSGLEVQLKAIENAYGDKLQKLQQEKDEAELGLLNVRENLQCQLQMQEQTSTRVKQLEAELEVAENLKRFLESKIEDDLCQVAELTKEKENVQTKLKNLEENKNEQQNLLALENEDLQLRLNVSQKDVESLKLLMGEATEQVHQLEARLKESENSRATQESECERIHIAITEQQILLATLKLEQFSDIDSFIANLKREKEYLQSQLTLIEEKYDRDHELFKRNEEMHNAVAEDKKILQIQLAKCEEELLGKTSLLKEATEQIEELQIIVKNSEDLIISLEQESDEVKQQLQNLQDNLRSQLQSHEDMTNRVKQLENELQGNKNIKGTLESKLQLTDEAILEQEQLLQALKLTKLKDVLSLVFELTKENEDIQTKLKNLEKNKEALYAVENQDLQFQLSKSRKDVENLKLVMDEAAEQIEQLELGLKKSEKLRETQESELQKADTAITQQTQLLLSLNLDSLTDVDNYISALKMEIEDVQSQVKLLEAKCNKDEKLTIMDQETNTHTKEKESNHLITKCEEELQSQSDLLMEATEKVHELQIALKNAENLIASQQSQLTLTEKAMAEMHDVLSDLQMASLGDMKNTITSLMDVKSSLEIQLQEIEEAHGVVVKKLKQENDETELKFGNMQENLQAQLHTHEETINRVAQMEAALCATETVNKSLESKVQLAEQVVSEQQDLLRSLKLSKLEDVRSLVARLTQDNEFCQAKLKNLEENCEGQQNVLVLENQDLQLQLRKSRNEVENLTLLMEEAAEQIQQLESDLKVSENSRATQASEVERAQTSISEQERFLALFKLEQLSDVDNYVKNLKEEKEGLQSILKQVEDKYISDQKLFKQNEEMYNTTAQEKETIRLQLNKTQEELQTQSGLLKNATEKGQELETAVKNSENLIDSLQSQLELAEKAVTELNEVLSSLQMDTLGDVKNAFTTLTDDKRRLESQLKEIGYVYNNKCHALGQENEAIQLQLSKSQEELQTQSTLLKEATEKIQELQTVVKNFKNEITSQQSQLALTEKAMAEQKNELFLQVATLEDARNDITSLMDAKSRMEIRLKEIEQARELELNKLKQEKDEAELKLQNIQENLQSQLQIHEETTNRVNQLEIALEASESAKGSFDAQLKFTEMEKSEQKELLQSLKLRQLGDVRVLVNKLTTQNKDFQTKLKNMEENREDQQNLLELANQDLQFQLNKSQKDVQNLKMLMDEAAEQIEHLELGLKESEKSRKTLQSELKRCQMAITEQEHLLTLLKLEKFDEVQNYIANLKREKECVQSQLKLVQEKCSTDQDILKQKEEMLQKIQQSIAKPVDSERIQTLETLVIDLKAHKTSLESELALAQKALSDQEQFLTSLKLRKLLEVQNLISKLRNEKEQLRGQLEAQETNYKRQKDNILCEKKQMEDKLRNLEQDVQILKENRPPGGEQKVKPKMKSVAVETGNTVDLIKERRYLQMVLIRKDKVLDEKQVELRDKTVEVDEYKKKMREKDNEIECLVTKCKFLDMEKYNLENLIPEPIEKTDSGSQCDILEDLLKRVQRGEEIKLPKYFPDYPKMLKEKDKLLSDLCTLEQWKRNCDCDKKTRYGLPSTIKLPETRKMFTTRSLSSCAAAGSNTPVTKIQSASTAEISTSTITASSVTSSEPFSAASTSTKLTSHPTASYVIRPQVVGRPFSVFPPASATATGDHSIPSNVNKLPPQSPKTYVSTAVAAFNNRCPAPIQKQVSQITPRSVADSGAGSTAVMRVTKGGPSTNLNAVTSATSSTSDSDNISSADRPKKSKIDWSQPVPSMEDFIFNEKYWQ